MKSAKLSRSFAVVAAGLCLAACASRQVHLAPSAHGDVSYQEVRPEDSGTKRYELKAGQLAMQPTVAVNPAPVYPARLLPLHLPPTEITAQLAVNGEGKVYNVIVPGEAQADPSRRAFIAAVRQVMPNWRFTPLVIEHTSPDGRVLSSEHPPFSQFFVFHFKLRNGKPVSSTQPSTTPGAI